MGMTPRQPPRKPRLTANRIRGLAAMAEHLRQRAAIPVRRQRTFLSFESREQATQIRRAIAYIDGLTGWAKEKADNDRSQ